MSVAIVGGAAIGLAGTYLKSRAAGKAARRAGNQAADADAAQLAFDQERYDEWQATYGPIEDSLAAYYDTLDPTLRTVQGLEQYEKEKDRAMKQMNENLAQRGIATSGIKAQGEMEFAVAGASDRARIRAEAPISVAKEKLSFLQVGLNQNPDAGMRSSLSDQARDARGIRDTTAANAGIASGALFDAGTDFLGSLIDKWKP